MSGREYMLKPKKNAEDAGEINWTKQICNEMRAVGAIVHPLTGAQMSSGLPDRLVVHPNWSGLLEFKGSGTKLRVNQSIVIRDIISRNESFVFIVRKPNLIQIPCALSVDPNGCKTLAEFDGSGSGLLYMLMQICANADLC